MRIFIIKDDDDADVSITNSFIQFLINFSFALKTLNITSVFKMKKNIV